MFYLSLIEIIVLLKVLFLVPAAFTLSLIEISIPKHLPVGARATLICRWQLGPADVLYSVKWYKDGKEFFRHVPKDYEPRRKFHLPGVFVHDSDELGSKLILGPATTATGGRYRCEVSGEGPLFPTVSDHGDIIVVVLPNHGPIIYGCHQRYKVGDEVSVNCTSGKSRPAVKLTWFINDQAAATTVSSNQPQHDGKVTSTAKLQFVLTERHFHKGTLKLKCLATLGTIYWKSYEESALNEREEMLTSVNKFSEERILISSSSAHTILHQLIFGTFTFILFYRQSYI